MNTRLIVAALLLTACQGAAPSGSASGELTAQNHRLAYRVVTLPSLGGAVSRGNSVNDRGQVAGYSNLPGDQTRHAAVWVRGQVTDLGTLGGPNSSVVWPVKNNRGLLVGIAQTATPEPLGERWSCAAFFPGAQGSGFTCQGVVWERGVIRALPTFGGHNGYASGANDQGQVVGWAENAVRDPSCVAPQVLQFRAARWDPGSDGAHELAPLPGDPASAATAINGRGQVVGISGSCDQAVGRRTARAAVVWERSVPRDLGALGGSSWNTPTAINDRGDVAGFASLPGGDPDDPPLHAVLWRRGNAVRDLGTLPGDVTSQASGLNNRGQVVGTSCDANGACRAFLWQDGMMTDLNAQLAPATVLYLESAQDINDAGWITGRALDPTAGRPAYLARPLTADH